MAGSRALDVIMTVAARIGGKSVNLLVFVIVARNLQLGEMGIYGYIFSITLIFSTILDVGVRNSLAIFIGREPSAADAYTHQSFLLWLALSLLTVPAIYVAFRFSGMDIARPQYLVPSLLLLAAMLYLRMMQGTLLGRGAIAVYNRTELASRMVLLVLTVALVLLKMFTLFTALWTLAVSQVVAASYLFAGQYRSIRAGRGNGLGRARALVSRGFLFMLAVLEMNLSRRLAFLAVGYFASANYAGVFFALQRLTEVITEVGMAVSVVIFSHNVRAETSETAVRSTAHSTRICFMVFVLISIVFAATSSWSVPLLLGADYGGHTSLFLILLAATLAGSVWTILFPSLSVVTSPMTVFWLLMPGLTLNAALIYPLMLLAGPHGAAWSMLAANVILTASFLWMYKKRFGVAPSEFLIPQRSDFAGLLGRLNRSRKPK